MNRYLLAIPAALALTLVTAPAYATTPEPYVIAAWTINTPGFDGTEDVWGGGGQTDPITAATASTDLDQIKASVPCGRWVQIDLYNNDDTTAVLIAGGVLYGPSNPAESPATDVSPWFIASWWSGDCVQPDDEVTPGSSESLDCGASQWVIKNWHTTVTYTGDKHGYTASEPVRTDDPDTYRPATITECPTPEPKCGTAGTLACTPGGENWPWLAWSVLGLLSVGSVLTFRKRIFN